MTATLEQQRSRIISTAQASIRHGETEDECVTRLARYATNDDLTIDDLRVLVGRVYDETTRTGNHEPTPTPPPRDANRGGG